MQRSAKATLLLEVTAASRWGGRGGLSLFFLQRKTILLSEQQNKNYCSGLFFSSLHCCCGLLLLTFLCRSESLALVFSPPRAAEREGNSTN